MRVAFFIKSTTFHKDFGGIETLNKTLCEGLTAKGHDVWVFSPMGSCKCTSQLLHGVNYVFIPCSYRYLFAELNKNSWYKKSYEVFCAHHSQKPFDLVVGQSSAAVSITVHKDTLGVKVVSIAHGTALSEFKTSLANASTLKEYYMVTRNAQYFVRQFFGRQREFVLNSNKIVAVSNFVKSALIDETYVPEEWVEVIHNGVDVNGFLPIVSRSQTKVTLLYVGQLSRDKGVKELVNLVLKNNALNLMLVGDGPMRQELTDMIVSQNAADRVTLAGKVSPELVKGYYLDPTINVFVFPTKRVEGFPMVLVEAMLAGLPIVAFNMGGVQDAVIDNVTGYLVNSGQYMELEHKIIELAVSTEKRIQFGVAAHAKAISEFSLDVMISKYEKVFAEVLK